ncbi:ribosome 60S biogenesis N-terminal-domain-containing protein [Gautieria morchelliformis]|nr:ribosome 60S biogenesis N-terminal-domain-containing protein [Gautieria morchelliformis]
MTRTDRADRPKKAKLSHPTQDTFLLNADDIQTVLQSNDVEMLTQALTTLRNQLTVRFEEDALLPQDERLLLAQSWLQRSPGARDIFSIIRSAPKPSPQVSSLCIAVLSALLNLLSTHFIYHNLGEAIIKTLLSSSQIRQLNANLADTSSDLILSTLKLFNAMSNFAGGVEKRSVMDEFAWGQKSLHKLLFLRRKGKGARVSNPLAHPDIRTLYVSFVLSFLSTTTPTPIKLSFLEQHREIFLLIFKGIPQDPYLVARRILEICWEGLWGDPKIKRTLKISLFNESVLKHLLKLYDRDAPEDGTADHVPADLIHHFMLAITTRPGVGICFKSRGWYPRDNSFDEATELNLDSDAEIGPKGQGGKIYNKILANIVKTLKVNEDARQQELALKILEACPELVASYWSAANLTLEPRLSSRWITNLSIVGTIISLPIPTSSFLLPQSTHLDPSPPPLSSMTTNVLPSVLNKTHLTKGLQSPSSLVRHCTALVLSKCLTKLDNVLRILCETARKLEEDNDTGQWLKRFRELEVEVERRVPDFMVIVAMVQQKHAMPSREQYQPQTSLLTESALRLLWLYHKLFPRLVSEVRFDVGKLLLGVFDFTHGLADSSDMNTDSFLMQNSQNGLDVLRQLHVVRLLKESDQFAWSTKSNASHSHLYAIMMLYSKTSHLAVRDVTSDLLTHLLSSSILFSHDLSELDLWLSALPSTRRGANATAPDGTPLTDESNGVLVFLDDCIQRCLKTPYRYLEAITTFFNDKMHLDDKSFTPHDPGVSPSPLLMTVLEQLRAKIIAGLLSPSDALAVATFVRKIVCGLTAKMHDLQRIWAIVSEIEDILCMSAVAPESTIMQEAIKREADLLSHVLRFIQNPSPQSTSSTSPAVQGFLAQVESLPIPSSETASSSAAYELVDWIRIIHPPLHHTEIGRLLGLIVRLSPSAATEFLYQIDPQHGVMWNGSDEQVKLLEKTLSFEWAYLHSTPEQLLQKDVRDSLVSIFFSKRAWNRSLERRVSICMHRVATNNEIHLTSTSLRHAELSLLGSIMRTGHSQRDIDLSRLKHTLFLESDPIKELCYSRDISAVELAGLSNLVGASLQPKAESDHKLAFAYSNFWMESENCDSFRTCTIAAPWLPFMKPSGVIKHLDTAIRALECGHLLDGADQTIVNVILDTLVQHSTNGQVLRELERRMRGLIAIRPSLHEKTALDALLLLTVDSRLPLGCNSLPLAPQRSRKVSDLTLVAQERWDVRSAELPLDSALIPTLLNFKNWDETIARIISGFIYRSSASRCDFWAWLFKTEPDQVLSPAFVLIPLHAYLEVMTLRHEDGMNPLPDAWFSAVVQLLFRTTTSDGLRTLSLYPVLHEVSDVALKWMVPQFSGDGISENDITVVDEISQLIPHMEAKPHLVEPIVKAAIQNCLHMPSVVKCLPPLVLSAHLKPAAVNRHLQSIVQHAQLFRSADPSVSSRQPIIYLLHTLFHMHPTNTCQPSHIAPLTRLYGGTLSLSDRFLLSILNLYEIQRKESVASMFRSWSTTPSAPPSPDIIRAITSLDPAKVFRTCTAFPTRRRLDGHGLANLSISDDGLYDPVFLSCLVAQLVLEHRELSSTEWVQVFRSNIVSLVVCVFTSRNEDFRRVGATTLAGLLQRVQEAEFLEKDQVVYILNILRDLLPPPSSASSAPRLATYSTLLLAHALRATFYPSSFLYPVISRFLLQRPELDTTDVPMLYSLLYSSEDGEWAKERAWMVRFLCEAMHEGGAQDWKVLRRRHTWDLVASMWQATRPAERSLRKGILEFLANLSSNQHAITPLVLRSSLLTWIEMQLEARTANEGESIAWVKILENIIVTANEDKVGKATRGEFYASLTRCLCLLLRGVAVSGKWMLRSCAHSRLRRAPETADTLATQIGLLHIISRVLLRVAASPAGRSVAVAGLLQHASHALRRFEPLLSWADEATAWTTSGHTVVPGPPHRARGLFDIADATADITGHTRHALRAWGETVATLWEAAMVLGRPAVDVGTWSILTCRLLLLRASPRAVAAPRSHVGLEEWARRETLACILDAEAEGAGSQKT